MTEILNLDVEPASSAAQRLAQAISDLSEDCWCAGWLDDCEHVLWEMLGITEPREWGMGYVTPEDLIAARQLQRRLYPALASLIRTLDRGKQARSAKPR